MALVWPWHQWHDSTLGPSCSTLTASSCDLWAHRVAVAAVFWGQVWSVPRDSSVLGLGMDCMLDGSSDLWLEIDHAPGSSLSWGWVTCQVAVLSWGQGWGWGMGYFWLTLPAWGPEAQAPGMLGLDAGKEAWLKRSLWCALTADNWDPRNRAAHCQGMMGFPHRLSLHRCG